jgi:hypothetical protein
MFIWGVIICNMKTAILKCDCEHDFQSKTYGKERRLHNVGRDDKTARCTVCGREKNYKGGGDDKKKK